MGHAKFTLRNTANSLVYALFGDYIKDNAPENSTPETAVYYRQLARFSASFAFIADVGLMRLGGSLKRKERLSARLGDILSMLYLCSATLKRFEDDGRPSADLPLLYWSMQDALYQMQQAFDEFLTNFPGHITLIWVLKALVFPLGKRCKRPADDLAHEVSRLMMEPGAVRDRLTTGIYVPTADNEPMADLELALQCVIECGAVEAKLREATKLRQITARGDEKIAQALALKVITAAEADLLNKMKDLRSRVVKVDDFPADFGKETKAASNGGGKATRSAANSDKNTAAAKHDDDTASESTGRVKTANEIKDAVE